jgi:coiled-coil domain-containing protein 39
VLVAVQVGDDGQEKSQAYFIIKAAQKREELQREGDNLDQEIQKCEREIRAMQNTLTHLNGRNLDLRSALQKAKVSGQEAEELRRMEEQAKLAHDELFHKKKQLQRLNTDCEDDIQRLEQVRR